MWTAVIPCVCALRCPQHKGDTSHLLQHEETSPTGWTLPAPPGVQLWSSFTELNHSPCPKHPHFFIPGCGAGPSGCKDGRQRGSVAHWARPGHPQRDLGEALDRSQPHRSTKQGQQPPRAEQVWGLDKAPSPPPPTRPRVPGGPSPRQTRLPNTAADPPGLGLEPSKPLCRVTWKGTDLLL